MIGMIGASVGSAVMQSNAQKSAARTQSAAAQKGIDEQRRQYDAMQALLKPYVEAGTGALSSQLALAGVSGAEAQQAAINAIQQGPEFAALTRQGEEAILQNAAATGGLRGGNVQGALAQFRPQVLSSLIEQQYGRLGGLATAGQNAATGVGTAGLQTGQNISNALSTQGAAQAGGTLAAAQTWGNTIGSIGTGIGRGMAFQGYQPLNAAGQQMPPLTFAQGFMGGFQ
jgi:hypothetical protein